MKPKSPLAWAAALLGLLAISPHPAGALETVEGVADQPLVAATRRLVQALELVGSPLPAVEVAALEAAYGSDSPGLAVQQILDPHCLAAVEINPESRVKVLPGPVDRRLMENGWRTFLVKVVNQAGVTAKLEATSPNALPLPNSPPDEIRDRWLDLASHDVQPMAETLSGLAVEYRILSLYARDAGSREAKLAFSVGQGTQDLGFRNEVDLLFASDPSVPVVLEVLDDKGEPTTAAFEVRDAQGRIYPSQAKRLAPDFAFHPQVYRSNGETLALAAGSYSITMTRGPESLPVTREIAVTPETGTLSFQARRWIDASELGWWSGDHHIHAAGCSHYSNPTEGVHAPDMLRHIVGEDLKVGSNLTWGPCFDYQKQFFTGQDDPVSTYPYLLRYDIEVSGFGSHQSGHLCLLRLTEQIYPGGDSTDHWPTLCLNTLRWAKKQGALCGPAHSGWGLSVPTDELPNFHIPPFDGIGANEYIVDITHEVEGPDGTPVPAVDFLSMVDTPSVWELNIWYHTLNCGFRPRISGETDFPCIYGERVGLGRSYVQLDGALDYESWCEGIRSGRNYVGDGRSHLIGFKVGETAMGYGDSTVELEAASQVTATVSAAAFLDADPSPNLTGVPYTEKPYWHIERARQPGTRTVMVELVANGKPVASQPLVADGEIRELTFADIPIDRSSWLAVRILASSHSNPVWVTVAGAPVYPSKQSAQWCLDSVAQCWSQKESFIADDEMADARAAYAHATESYERILAEAHPD
ncbi:hypothetical protein BH23VER1_BH23VER1_22900 [soil metagenome]